MRSRPSKPRRGVSGELTRAAEELCVNAGRREPAGQRRWRRRRPQALRSRARAIGDDRRGARDLCGGPRRAGRIAVGTERLVERQTSGVLTVSTSPDFAAKWLVHRLSRLAEVTPASICACRQRCIASTSRARTSTSRSGIGDGNWAGPGCGRFAPSSFCRFVRRS